MFNLKLLDLTAKIADNNNDLYQKFGPKINKYLYALQHETLSKQRIIEIETKLLKYFLLGVNYKKNPWELEHTTLSFENGKTTWEQVFHEESSVKQGNDFIQEKQALERKSLSRVHIFGKRSVDFLRDKLSFVHSPECKNKADYLFQHGFDLSPDRKFISHANFDIDNQQHHGRAIFLTLGNYSLETEKIDCLFISSLNILINYEMNRPVIFAVKDLVQAALLRSNKPAEYSGIGLINNKIFIGPAFVVQGFSEKYVTAKAKQKSLADFEKVVNHKIKELEFEIEAIDQNMQDVVDVLMAELMFFESTVKNDYIKKLRNESNLSVIFFLMDEYKKQQETIDGFNKDLKNAKTKTERQSLEQLVDGFKIMHLVFTDLLFEFCEYELKIPPDSAIVMRDISNSMMKNLINNKKLGALVTGSGGKKSHVLICARNSNIPAIVGIEDIDAKISTGDLVIVDQKRNLVFKNPPKETLKKYQKELERYQKIETMTKTEKDEPYLNSINENFFLNGSLDNDIQLDYLQDSGCRKIGLVRSEYEFFDKSTPPTFDDHLRYYTLIAKKSPGAIIRTFDFMGDKGELAYLNIETFKNYNNNAFVKTAPGHEMLSTQLRAIIEVVAKGGNFKILFPYCESAEDFAYYEKCLKQEIMKMISDNKDNFEIIKRLSNIQYGLMIETAGILKFKSFKTLDLLLSIGSADLACALLKLNRELEYELYHSIHPKVLKTYAEYGPFQPSVCGNIGGDIFGAFILYHLGIRNLTISIFDIPKIAYLFRRLGASDQEFAAALLAAKDHEEVIQLTYEYIRRKKEISKIFADLGYDLN